MPTITNIPATPQPEEQLAAAFAAVFKDIKAPATARSVTLADRLKPYRRHVLKLRRRGLTWQQISAGLADPRIGVAISEKMLGSVFGEKKPKPAAPPAPTAPKSRRVSVDPATGRVIPL